MTVNEAFIYGIKLLKNAGNDAPASDAGVLLCSVLQLDRALMYAHGAAEILEEKLEIYLHMLKCRSNGMPLQYLTGKQEFMSLPFEVGQGVLVPRQDTEVLVETVINLCTNPAGRYRVLDIGTGSGCIAVSLAYYLPESSVTAVDKMQDAIAIARRNAMANGMADRVRFIKSNMFEELSGEKFDIIVSNPPYIRTDEIKLLQREIRCYEPIEALDGGIDGMSFYREIINEAPGFFNEGGLLAFETGYDQATDVAELMSDNFCNIKINKDLSGIDRVVTGRRK